jgi:hypothetical protein
LEFVVIGDGCCDAIEVFVEQPSDALSFGAWCYANRLEKCLIFGEYAGYLFFILEWVVLDCSEGLVGGG